MPAACVRLCAHLHEALRLGPAAPRPGRLCFLSFLADCCPQEKGNQSVGTATLFLLSPQPSLTHCTFTRTFRQPSAKICLGHTCVCYSISSPFLGAGKQQKIFGFLCWFLTFCPPHSECPCGSYRAMNQVWLTPLRLLSNLHGFLLNLVSMAMSLLNSSPE